MSSKMAVSKRIVFVVIGINQIISMRSSLIFGDDHLLLAVHALITCDDVHPFCLVFKILKLFFNQDERKKTLVVYVQAN